MKTLRMAAECERAIRAHAEAAFPNECCGALIGRDGEVVEVRELLNLTDEGPRRRFRVSDADYRTAEAHAAAVGLALAGFYHSHPDHPAVPSEYDLDRAWPNWSYVIVSVYGGGAREMRSWQLREDRSQFDEEAIHAMEPRRHSSHAPGPEPRAESQSSCP